MKQGRVKQGEPVALRGSGIRVRPPERSRGYSVFGFMSNDVSAEVNKGIAIAGTAQRDAPSPRAGRDASWSSPGPAIVHSGGDAALARLVADGWIDVILTGNAFAVHDMEKSILKTSLGVCQLSGRAVDGGSRNHLLTINEVNRAGGVRQAVEQGVVTSGRHVRGGQEGHHVRAGGLDSRRRAARGRRTRTSLAAQQRVRSTRSRAPACA